MAERKKDQAKNDITDNRVRVFGTDAANPDDRRTFVWTKSGWFERIQGESGGVAFIPAAKSEDEVRELISRGGTTADLVQVSGKYRKTVTEEFMEQTTSYEDSPEYSEEEPTEDDDQQYHQHD